MKKIVLINLPATYLSEPDAQFPLGLLYLGTELQNAGYDVTVLDLSRFPETKIPEADIYGITATSMQIPIMNQFIDERLSNRNGLIICGGYCSLTPEYISKKIDIIFKGHIGAKEFNEALAAMHECCGRMFFNGKRFPDKELIPNRNLIHYKGGNIFFAKMKHIESTQLITSFGCLGQCVFCASANYGIAFRDIKTVIEEIRDITEKGIYYIRIADDNFLANERRVIQFYDELKKSRIKIEFRISVRVHPLKAYLLNMLKEVGLKEVSLGIESFDQSVLDGLKKKTTVYQNIKAVEICNELDIPVRILMMIGTPFQTNDTIKKNIDILKKINYNIVAVSQFKPLPGTDTWKNPDYYNCKILTKDLSKYNFYSFQDMELNIQNSVIEIDGIPIEETNRQNKEFLEWVKDNKLNWG